MTVYALEVLLIALCVLGSAFFSGMETGVISIRRLRLRHQVRRGKTEARILTAFLEEPDRLLGATLVGTNLCVVTASIMAASLATGLVGRWGEAGSTLVMAVVILLFGEYLPKAWFRASPYDRAEPFARLLHLAWKVLWPVSTGLTWLAGLLIPGKSSQKQDLYDLATRAELKLLAREGQQYGVLTPEERVMIHRVIELSDKPARTIMIARGAFTEVDADATVSEFLAVARESGFTRYPVYDRNANRFVGLVNVFDVLTGSSGTAGEPMRAFARSPVFLPQDLPADEILPRLRLARQPMGLVVDPKAEVIGLVTTEDILEQIVGAL